jgi:3-methyladenine DNA glycosylase AlkD
MTSKEALAWLEQRGTAKNVEGMARYGIKARRAFGVSMGTMLPLKKRLGRDHDLALALWKTGWYEARLLAALVDDPAMVTKRQMNAWAAGFENWADCDTVCFHLFDRTPFAWGKASEWTASPKEFVKRAGFALMASLALHAKSAPDKNFLTFLPLIEAGAGDPRNFVKKAVSWALRGIGRRSAALHIEALKVARRLAESPEPAARWVGKDVIRDLTRPAIIKRVAAVESRKSRSSTK